MHFLSRLIHHKLLSFAFFACASGVLQAADYVVSNTNDSGAGSLRYAIQEANENTSASSNNKHRITFQIPPSEVIYLVSGQLEIRNYIEITGDSFVGSIIDARELESQSRARNRIIHVIGDYDLTLNNLILRNGNENDEGGAILLEDGFLSTSRCWFYGNSAGKGGAISSSRRGGDFLNTTFSENTANDFGGGVVARGGLNRFINCTFSGNIANEGGGLYNFGSIELLNCTFSENSAFSGGGLYNNGQAKIVNTIIANSHKRDLGYWQTVGDLVDEGDLVFRGNNIVEDGAFTDLLNYSRYYTVKELKFGDPKLLPLKNNGGIGPTHGLYWNSPALNTGVDDASQEFGLAPFDARGYDRFVTQDDDIDRYGYFPNRIDLGAVEMPESFPKFFNLPTGKIYKTVYDERFEINNELTRLFPVNREDYYLQIEHDIGFNEYDTYFDDVYDFDPGREGPGEYVIFYSEEPPHFNLPFQGQDPLSYQTSFTIYVDEPIVVNSNNPIELDNAIREASENPFHRTILFSPEFTEETQTIYLGDNPLVVSGDVRIVAPEETGLVISAKADALDTDSSDRVFIVESTGNLILESVTLADGSSRYYHRDLGYSGGGIHNLGMLTLKKCVLRNNNAENENGGALYNQGSLYAFDTTWHDNFARDGGGIYNRNSALMLLENCTLYNNEAILDGGAIRSAFTQTSSFYNCTVSGNVAQTGGGISNWEENQTNLIHCTINGNESSYGSGGVLLDSQDGKCFMLNSIIANSVPQDFQSDGVDVNLIGDNIVMDGSANVYGSESGNPKLLALADNGGCVMTHALENDSIALDRAFNSNFHNLLEDFSLFIPKDARGYPRESSAEIAWFDWGRYAQSDLGAFETHTHDLAPKIKELEVISPYLSMIEFETEYISSGSFQIECSVDLKTWYTYPSPLFSSGRVHQIHVDYSSIPSFPNDTDKRFTRLSQTIPEYDEARMFPWD